MGVCGVVVAVWAVRGKTNIDWEPERNYFFLAFCFKHITKFIKQVISCLFK